jgi:hypothetical protein
MDVDAMPHLCGESAEFIALADSHAVVDAHHIPLHSHVLARSSKVCGQLFTSLAEAGGGTPRSCTDLSHLFAEESLHTVLVTLFLLYNTNDAEVQSMFEFFSWRREQAWSPDIPVDTALMQSVVGLADKLDARQLLEAVERVCARGAMLRQDLLGWLATGVRLHLHWMRDRALNALVDTLQSTCRHTAAVVLPLLRVSLRHAWRQHAQLICHKAPSPLPADLLPPAPPRPQDPRWKELDNSLLLLLVDGMAASHLPGIDDSLIPPGGWKDMGDLTAARLPGGAGAPPAAEAAHELGAAAQLQAAQAAAEWDEAFDDEMTSSEEEEEDPGDPGDW